jgi:hypothetical protein
METMAPLGIYLIIVGLFAWFVLLPYSWTNAIRYAIKFKVAVNQVHTDDKPSDCDWTRAPLGNKGCHFKAIVNTFNAAGESLGGDDAPKYRRDSKTGKAIVSYDRGKTWDSWEGPIPDMQVKSVEIWWDKVTENE